MPIPRGVNRGIEEGTHWHNYTFYSYNNSEFNYIIKVNGSNTGIILGNPNSKSEAEECFKRLTFSMDK